MSDVEKAVRYAYKLLSYRGRSEKELTLRLNRKGFSDHAVREVLGRLKEYGYLNDNTLALSLKRKAAEVKLLGSAGAGQYLRQMGIPGDIVKEVLSDYDELESAGRLADRKLRAMNDSPPSQVKRRLAGYLQRRGYSTDTIRKTIKNYESGITKRLIEEASKLNPEEERALAEESLRD